MKIAEKIKSALSERASRANVHEVRIGMTYTAVRVGEREVGLACTSREGDAGCCRDLAGDSMLAGRKAIDLLSLLGSGRGVESTLGLAAANALVNRRELELIPGDILDALDFRPQDRVGMVGYFQPLAGPLRDRVSSLTIFEKNIGRGSELLPEDNAAELLPGFDVAIITSTAIVNGTIDGLLALARNCREVILLGASTPLVPGAFRDTPVTFLSGVEVTDPEGILKVVSEGGGTPRFKGLVRKVNLKINRGVKP
jgi:uncharacterized protein (DUF4213/DUF364 family)